MAKLSARGCAVHVGEDAQAQALRGRRLADLGEDDHAALAPRRRSICRTMRTGAGMNPRRCATGGGSPSESANGPARVARAVLVRRERGVRERGRTGRNLGSEARKGPLAGSLIERTPGFQCGLRRRIDLSRACCSALRGGRLPFSISTASKGPARRGFPRGWRLRHGACRRQLQHRGYSYLKHELRIARPPKGRCPRHEAEAPDRQSPRKRPLKTTSPKTVTESSEVVA